MTSFEEEFISKLDPYSEEISEALHGILSDNLGLKLNPSSHVYTLMCKVVEYVDLSSILTLEEDREELIYYCFCWAYLEPEIIIKQKKVIRYFIDSLSELVGHKLYMALSALSLVVIASDLTVSATMTEKEILNSPRETPVFNQIRDMAIEIIDISCRYIKMRKYKAYQQPALRLLGAVLKLNPKPHTHYFVRHHGYDDTVFRVLLDSESKEICNRLCYSIITFCLAHDPDLEQDILVRKTEFCMNQIMEHPQQYSDLYNLDTTDILYNLHDDFIFDLLNYIKTHGQYFKFSKICDIAQPLLVMTRTSPKKLVKIIIDKKKKEDEALNQMLHQSAYQSENYRKQSLLYNQDILKDRFEKMRVIVYRIFQKMIKRFTKRYEAHAATFPPESVAIVADIKISLKYSPYHDSALNLLNHLLRVNTIRYKVAKKLGVDGMKLVCTAAQSNFNNENPAPIQLALQILIRLIDAIYSYHRNLTREPFKGFIRVLVPQIRIFFLHPNLEVRNRIYIVCHRLKLVELAPDRMIRQLKTHSHLSPLTKILSKGIHQYRCISTKDIMRVVEMRRKKFGTFDHEYILHNAIKHVPMCDGCGSSNIKELMICSRCQGRLYCSRYCQVRHHKSHCKFCKPDQVEPGQSPKTPKISKSPMRSPSNSAFMRSPPNSRLSPVKSMQQRSVSSFGGRTLSPQRATTSMSRHRSHHYSSPKSTKTTTSDFANSFFKKSRNSFFSKKKKSQNESIYFSY
mmetsp:Transcript_10865/g.15928  ORF Transcript_10865/g.15928 Transcript_10865/m.15928 type:complete len:740 (-) Transcript_10865:2399-4618(-)